MVKFQIQVRNPDDGRWESQHTVTPAYTFGTMRMRHHWFFHITIGVIANLTKAEKAAHKQAIRLAKKLYWKQPCRVHRVSMWNGVELKDVLWQNGKAVMSEKQLST